MEYRNFIRTNLKLIFLIFVGISFSFFVVFNKISIANAKDELLSKQKVLSIQEEAYNKTGWIEDTLSEFYLYVGDIKKLKFLDLHGIEKDLNKLIAQTAYIDSLSAENGILVISGKTLDLRTTDYILDLLKTYGEFYGKISNIELLSVSSSDIKKEVAFNIKMSLNVENNVEDIFTDDFDGDGIKNDVYKNVFNPILNKEVSKKIIKDVCPFSDASRIISSKVLNKNKELIPLFPYYKNNLDYFVFDQKTGCLNGDLTIDGKIFWKGKRYSIENFNKIK